MSNGYPKNFEKEPAKGWEDVKDAGVLREDEGS